MKKSVRIGILIAGILALLVLGFFAGYKIAYDGFENSLSTNTLDPQTFYAQIKDIDGNHLLVEGLPVNDINFRSQFYLSVSDETKLEWRHTPITPDELDVGNTISVTFTGAIRESYPAQITDVVKIQLLDDEK